MSHKLTLAINWKAIVGFFKVSVHELFKESIVLNYVFLHNLYILRTIKKCLSREEEKSLMVPVT